MKTRIAIAAVCLAFAAWMAAEAQQEALPPSARPQAAAPPTDARHYSYAIGLDISTSFRTDNIPLDVDMLIAGIKDGVSGAQPKYSRELCGAAMERLTNLRLEAQSKRNKAYLAANAKDPGVKTLPSGLQYKVIKTGAGPSPKLHETVQVNYRGQLIDGTVFDSTQPGEPADFEVAPPLIDGWVEALQKMKVGDKWQLVIPSELAYGEEGADPIPPNSTLVFEIELLGIKPAGAAQHQEATQPDIVNPAKRPTR